MVDPRPYYEKFIEVFNECGDKEFFRKLEGVIVSGSPRDVFLLLEEKRLAGGLPLELEVVLKNFFGMCCY